MPPPLPSVSVVIASGAGGAFLFRLLDSLAEQARAEGAEVIVADRVGGAVVERLRSAYDWVQLVSVGTGTDGRKPTVPALRAAGVAAATGDVVAIIEEHCRAPASWLRSIRESFQPGDAAIGGPILDDAWPRLRDWAVYFSEYHNYMPPWGEGERALLNGANIAYRRSLLEEHRDALTRGYWEVELHPLLQRAGTAAGHMRGVQAMGAYHTGPFDYRYYLRQRYLLARVWGAMQREKAPLWKRTAYLVGAPIFPLLLLARIANRVRQSGRNVRAFLFTVPLLIPVVFDYVYGEWCGYAFGFGNALEEVE